MSSACKRAHLPGIVEAVGGGDENTVRTAHEPCGCECLDHLESWRICVYTKWEEIVVVSDGCDADQIAGGSTSKCQSGAAMSLDHQYVAGINHAVFFGQFE